jgi:PAS domain S-box-containing protein
MRRSVLKRKKTGAESVISGLDEIFQQAPSFFAVLRGPDYVFERANDAFLKLVGRKELVGKTVLEAIPEVRGQGFIELLDNVRATGEPYTARAVRAEIVPEPGRPSREIFVDFVYAPLRDSDGSVVGVITHGADVTEQVLARRSAEEATEALEFQVEQAQALTVELEQSNDQLQELNAEFEEARDQAERAKAELAEVLDSLTESVSVLDHQWRWRYLNPTARGMLRRMGRDPDQLIGRVIWDELPELLGTRFETETRGALEKMAPVEYEEFFETLGKWFLTRVVPSETGITTFSQDVTERHHSADALARSEEQFQLLANLIPTLAWMADPTGWIFWYNKRWYDYTGTTPQQMEGWGWQSVHDPEILPQVMARWSESIATGQPFEMEFPLKSAAGEFRWFLTRVAPLKDAAGKVTRWFGTNTDVQAQHEATEAATAANKAKSDFLAAMSHETRQPINATLSFVELFAMGMYGEVNDEQREALARIRRNQEQLLSVITDILSFARLEAGRFELNCVPVRATDILRDLPPLVEPQVKAKGIRFETACASNDLVALGDREKILQILTNLVTNALRATPKDGSITTRCSADDGWVQFEVEDTGVGIPPDKIDDIFAPFVQLGRALNKPRDGVGLGLAISRDFAEAMGGSLTAVSTLGEGSTFTLRLRRDDGAAATP